MLANGFSRASLGNFRAREWIYTYEREGGEEVGDGVKGMRESGEETRQRGRYTRKERERERE